jgi:ABC-type hemin transport system substrate-binding protein
MMRDIFCIWPHLDKPLEIIHKTETLALKRLKAEPAGTGVACLIWKNPYMTCGGDTYISRLLETCGAVNVFRPRKKRYFELTIDSLASAKPDLVLLPTEPHRFRASDRVEILAVLGKRGLRDCRVRIIDGQLLAWYGARTPIALKKLPTLLRKR